MAGAQARSGWLANLALVAASLLFVLLLLAAVEGALRLLGLGARAAHGSRLAYQQISPPLLEPDERPDGTPILRTRDPRLPYQAILRNKPANGLRVFSFGGSATAGLGFSPNVTFSRHLEVLLREALPDRSVEVVNLGIVALSSEQVKVLVDDSCRRFEPDLVVVYSGNNEFLEVHAEKYAAANATPLSRGLDLLAGTHLYRLLTRLTGGGEATPSLAGRDLSHEDLRLTQDRIIEHVAMTDAEIEAVVDRYEANIETIADAAAECGTPLLLLAVASNWEWRGRRDLPSDWPAELGVERPETPAHWREVVRALDQRLADEADPDRHEWLFRRALAWRALADETRARDDFRAAMNVDPHLRRALDAANDRVAAVARRRGVAFLDTVEALAAGAEGGIVGFREFYDYVHFTPDGAARVGVAIFEAMQRLGLVPAATGVDAGAYARVYRARIEGLREDFAEVDQWLGVGSDPARIHDRDLWKYDRMLDELDERLARDPDDVRARIDRGNAAWFRPDGAEDAARDWRAALELRELPPLRANLERLLAERPR
ncbi:MAG: SGNH/GDSL hydrolase family protein [Myxococcota bacterium]|nr:SGNH/GDSL hydrolase family protein [Myxococcota bacterium]